MKKRCILIVILLTFFITSFCSASGTVDSRRQMPKIFQNSWIYLSAGLSKTYFENSNFAGGYQFGSQTDNLVSLRLSIGHYFNPYIALAVSLMRGAHWNKFTDVQAPFPITPDVVQGQYSVSNNLFAVTARPTWTVCDRFSIYGEGGVGFISRNGFTINNTAVITNGTIVTPVVGAGINYQFPVGILLGLDSEYTPAINSQHQPAIVYVGVGLGFMATDDGRPAVSDGFYDFPLNFLQINYVNQNIFYADVARYFSPPYIPIFFDGHIKIAQGLGLMYERNFFHTNKNFSLEWGVSVAGWQSRSLKQDFYTFSLYPELKVWIVRLPQFDFYFTYSLAGPTYISRVYIDNTNSGAHFTFQDFLGFGAFLGENKRVNFNLKIVHYSNGNTIPENPGVDVPIMFSLGFTW